MLPITQVYIVSIVLGAVGLFLLYQIILFLRERNRPKPILHKPAATISGNLVYEYPATESILHHYRLTKILLGRGSSADVWIGESLTKHHRYAIKIIKMERSDILWKYEREKHFLRDLDHSNILRLFEVFYTPKQIFFVTELCTGGHLGHLLKRQQDTATTPQERNLSEVKVKSLIKQITQTILHLHDHGICHRDIKLQNILLENNLPDAQVKLVDFGNAVRFIGCTPLKKVVGTTYTVAPEVFRQNYDERCDIWSLGVITYILFCGKRPFEKGQENYPMSENTIQEILPQVHQNHASKDLIARILLGHYHFQYDAFAAASFEAIDFIAACFQSDYTKRAHAKDLMNHAWLKNDTSISLNGPSPSSSSPEAEPPNTTNEDSKTPGIIPSVPTLSTRSLEILVAASKRQLSHFGKSGMRDICMLAIAFIIPTPKIKFIRTLFQEMDYNNTGIIEKDEFYRIMETNQSQLTIVETESIFENIDQDCNGKICFLEFVAAMMDPSEVDVNLLHQAFQVLDQGKKKYLTRQDFLRILNTESSSKARDRRIIIPKKSILQQITNKTPPVPVLLTSQQARHQTKVEKLFTSANINHDGKLTFAEFLFAMAEGSVKYQSYMKELLETGEGSALLQKMNYSQPQPAVRSISISSFISHFRRQSTGSVKPSSSSKRNSPILSAKSPSWRNNDLRNNPIVLKKTSSIWQRLSFISPTAASSRVNSRAVLPAFRNNVQYVTDLSELSDEDLEPVEYLEDSSMSGVDKEPGYIRYRRLSAKPPSFFLSEDNDLENQLLQPPPEQESNHNATVSPFPLLESREGSRSLQVTRRSLTSLAASPSRAIQTSTASSDEEDNKYCSVNVDAPQTSKKLDNENEEINLTNDSPGNVKFDEELNESNDIECGKESSPERKIDTSDLGRPLLSSPLPPKTTESVNSPSSVMFEYLVSSATIFRFHSSHAHRTIIPTQDPDTLDANPTKINNNLPI